MKRKNLVILIIIFLSFLSCNHRTNTSSITDRINNISKSEMQSTMEFLSHDLLSGRAPGTTGGDLSEIYVKSIYKILDFKPGFKGKYLQEFILKGFKTRDINFSSNETRLKYLDEIVGSYIKEKPEFNLSSDLIFVGFGIKADLWQWDDYKDSDVKGKIVITRVNDPGFFNKDIFEGKTLTYYGRWTYHIEEAIKRGALGILLIHTDETAGYDWNVVRNSWSNEELFIPADLENNLLFRGWIKESSFEKLLKNSKHTLNSLNNSSLKRDFNPVDLGIKVKISGTNSYRSIKNKNILAHIKGKSDKRIVLSAHIDHLGSKDIDGDGIFNGAIDNASAVAAMIITAKILKEFQSSLNYSITLLACNSEEAGLLGSKYYVLNTNRDNIVANINFESTPVWKKSKSLMGIGARFSTFEDLIKKIAKEDNLAYSEFSLSNQGLFYRSDQFSFARFGIPAVWISAGEDEIDGKINYAEFWSKDYHTVKDEYNPDWELDGMRQTIKAAVKIIENINNDFELKWKDNLTFPIQK